MALPDTGAALSSAEATEPSIVVKDARVNYSAFTDANSTIREMMRNGFRQRRSVTVEALRGVSYTISAGESVGVIGHNGSGKSTMLRAIAGLTPVAGGEILVSDQPSLLGVGAVLKPALSGVRNIYMGCLALGMRKTEVDQRLDEIIEFTGLGDHINLPMKTYSSGMSARLHFAIATCVSPEILLIDEAFAVGDKGFRAKSLERLKTMQDHASTIMIVSHNPNVISQNCERVLWIDHGQLKMDGATGDVLDAYAAEGTDEG